MTVRKQQENIKGESKPVFTMIVEKNTVDSSASCIEVSFSDVITVINSNIFSFYLNSRFTEMIFMI